MAEPPSSQEVYITIHVMGKIGHVKSVLFAHTQKEISIQLFSECGVSVVLDGSP